MIDELIRDFIAVKHYERKLGRKLTEDEINGFTPITVITMDGVRVALFIEKIPFSYFYPSESGR